MAFSLAAAVLMAQLDPGALVPLYEQALAAREKEFGPEHPKVARSLTDLGLFLRNIGRPSEAVDNLKRALSIDRKALPPTDRLLCEDYENLASVAPREAAIQLHLQAAKCPDAAISARNWSKSGDLYVQRGDRASALSAYRQALQKEETPARLNDVAQLSEPGQAEPLIRRALAIAEKKSGPQHPETGVILNNLANVLLSLNRLREAEKLARRAVEVLESTLGPNHPRVATAASNLAEIQSAISGGR